MNTLFKIDILGINITSSKKEEILEYLLGKTQKNGNPVVIFTPNPEIIVYAHKHPEFKTILNKAEVALPDGVGVVYAGKILKKQSISRISGADFMLDMVSYLSSKAGSVKTSQKSTSHDSKSAYGIGLFGGQPGVAEMAADCLQKKYSGTQIEYVDSQWNEAKLKGKKMKILFVALGHPKQEKWIMDNKDKIPAEIIMAVGGSFDFISGRVRRAPVWVQKIGLEWLFRLINQPWRWKRQLALISFVKEVCMQALQPQKK